MVALSVGGKLAIIGIICIGVVLIPVQTSQLYQQLVARRVTQGAALLAPDCCWHCYLLGLAGLWLLLPHGPQCSLLHKHSLSSHIPAVHRQSCHN